MREAGEEGRGVAARFGPRPASWAQGASNRGVWERPVREGVWPGEGFGCSPAMVSLPRCRHVPPAQNVEAIRMARQKSEKRRSIVAVLSF